MDEDIPQELIQVTVSMSEVRRRIEQFLQHKRAQADANNALDFCGPAELSQNCARVDAILVRKKDSSSHLSVCNVLDRYTNKTNSELFTAPVKAPAVQSESHTYVEGKQIRPKGKKRTYDVDSLEILLKEIQKQQKKT